MLNIFTKRAILDVWQGSEYAFGNSIETLASWTFFYLTQTYYIQKILLWGEKNCRRIPNVQFFLSYVNLKIFCVFSAFSFHLLVSFYFLCSYNSTYIFSAMWNTRIKLLYFFVWKYHIVIWDVMSNHFILSRNWFSVATALLNSVTVYIDDCQR